MKEYEFDFYVMGSDAHISIITGAEGVAETVYKRMYQIAQTEEARYSRFKKDSELSLLNTNRTYQVSPEFLETFLCARALHEATRGVFNPLVDISRYGYDADIQDVRGQVRTAKEKAPYNVNLSSVVVDEVHRTITLQNGQNLDFGGFLKGRVAEKMAREAVLCAGVIVNIGGDIYTRGVDADGNPFTFSIENPHSSGEDISFVATNSGIATSGSYRRTWFLEGQSFHHVLDASGERNAESDVISATVIASSGACADAYATIPLVEGSVAGARMLEELECAYVLVCADGRVVTSFSRVSQELEKNLYVH